MKSTTANSAPTRGIDISSAEQSRLAQINIERLTKYTEGERQAWLLSQRGAQHQYAQREAVRPSPPKGTWTPASRRGGTASRVAA
jgi:hypothetical protein